MLESCPYKGLVPYGEEDAAYFFGRDRERRMISAALRASRLTVLYGESGAGKTSVLAAGVAHDLRDDPDYALVLFRNWRDEPMVGLLNAVRDSLSNLPGFTANGSGGQPNNWNALLHVWLESTKRSLLIVLDQFEEYFQYHPGESGSGKLPEELPRLLNQSDLPVNFVIALREDALGTLDRFKGVIPNLFDNLVRIEHLSRKAAEEAIVKPLNKFEEDLRAGKFSTWPDRPSPFQINEQVARDVVDEIVREQGGESDRVQAPYLQLVMTRWWEADVGSQVLRPETLQTLGGVHVIVERYLEDTLATFNPQQKEVVAEIFRYMVTPTGRKIAQTVTDLTKNLLTFLTVGGLSIEEILTTLQSSRLLRPVPPPLGGPPDVACYELAHDVVAKAAFEWRRQFRDAQQLAEAERKEKEATQRAEEQARQAKRFRRLSLALGGTLLLALAAIAFAYWQRTMALRSEARATLSAWKAEESTKDAIFAQKSAESARAEAQGSAATAIVARNSAEVERALAQRSEAIARSREFVTASILSQDRDPELSVLIAAQAVAATWPWDNMLLPEAEQQLHRAISASHVKLALTGHKGPVRSVAWSPEGQRLATASEDSTVKVWDAQTGKVLLTLTGHEAFVNSVAWNPDGKRLATASADSTAKVWDAQTGKELVSLKVGRVSSIAWSPDGRRLATASFVEKTKVWDVETGKELGTLSFDNEYVLSIAWSPDGKRVAMVGGGGWQAGAGGYGTAEVADAETGKKLLSGPSSNNYDMSSVAWSPDGKWVATDSSENSVDVWDAATGKELLRLTGHGKPVTSVAWSPNGKQLATASTDTKAKVWDAQTGKEFLSLSSYSASVFSVAWSPDGKWLATGSDDSTAKVWDVEKGKELPTLEGRGSPVRSVAWSPDGNRLATGTGSGTASVWDGETGKELLTLSGRPGYVSSVAWNPDGKGLAVGHRDGSTEVRDPGSGKELLTLSNYRSPVSSVAWRPDGKRLALGRQDGSAEVRDSANGRELVTLGEHYDTPNASLMDAVLSVAWSPDGKRLATGERGRTARVWDAETGKQLLTLSGHSDSVSSVAWSPDGKLLATGCGDGKAKVWNAETGRDLLTLSQGEYVFSVAWRPNGKGLAVGSDDGAVKLWDAETGKELLALSGHSGAAVNVAWSPDGKRLASASMDGTVRIYAIDIRDLMALARQRVTPSRSDDGCRRYLHVDKCPPFAELR